MAIQNGGIPRQKDLAIWHDSLNVRKVANGMLMCQKLVLHHSMLGGFL